MPEPEVNSVRIFREILIWPLLIEDVDEDIKKKERLNHWAEKLKDTNWKEIDDLFKRSADDQNETCYAECVYFHPFVQRFLYNKDKQTLRIFSRTDINQVSIKIEHPDPKKNIDEKFNVDRIHMYLFDVGVALFVVEVSTAKVISLKTAQEILDRFRRAYSPYWKNDRPGHCPDKVQWLYNETEIGSCSTYHDKEKMINDVRKNIVPPMAAHWEYLIKPFIPWQDDNNKSSSKIELKQIGDERIPVMAYLAFDDPKALTDGDFMRLGLLDDQGSSDKLPYGTDFMADFKTKYCYDRFWDITTKGQKWMRTRYLCCGYAFVVIGKDDRKKKKEDPPPTFTDKDSGILAHFRHHYLQMGILVHFYHASLLMFSEKRSQAVADWKSEKDKPEFRKRIKLIQESLLRFTQRYWFIDISNQVQARELFDLWKKHLGVEKWFEQVKEETININEFLDAEQQEKQAKSSVRLTVVATIGLSLSILVNTLAICQENLMKFFGEWIPRLFFVVTIIIIIFLILVHKSDEIGKWFDSLSEDKK